MQTFKDSKLQATAKDLNNLFGQRATFKLSGEAEAGNAEEQPARNNLTGGNDCCCKMVEQTTIDLQQQSFFTAYALKNLNCQIK